MSVSPSLQGIEPRCRTHGGSILLLFPLLLAACQDEKPSYPEPNRTTDLGFRYNYHSDLSAEIDEAYRLFLVLEPTADLDALRAYPIVVMDGATVNGVNAGYIHYGSHIEIAIPPVQFGVLSQDWRETLRHEWKHVLYGDWHP